MRIKGILQLFLFPLLFFSCTIREHQPDGVQIAHMQAYAPAEGMIKEALLIVKEGDLIVRRGQEFSSQLISQFSRTDKTYSHAGLVFFENGYPMVYHILPGDQNPDEKLRKDSLYTFCLPRKNFGFALYRYQLDSAQIETMKTTIFQWYKEKIGFDHEFDLRTDNRMYCSEMIRKALLKATHNQLSLQLTQPTEKEATIYSRLSKVPAEKVVHNKIVAIDNLYLHPQCQLIKRFDFTQL